MTSSIYADYGTQEISAEGYLLVAEQMPNYNYEDVPKQYCQVEKVSFC